MEVDKLKRQRWTRGEYLISTDPSLVPLDVFNKWLATDEMYWATSMPLSVLRQTLDNSLVFGLYHAIDSPQYGQDTPVTGTKEAPLIGIARCVTDFTTFVYLTDVYIEPHYQGQGLGTWLIEAVQEVIDSMPFLRRSLLFTSNWERAVPLYERLMRVEPIETKLGSGLGVLSMKGPGFPGARKNGPEAEKRVMAQ